jgi:hypothetical protein
MSNNVKTIRNALRILIERGLSDELIFHVLNGAGVDQNIFRPGSHKFMSLFCEARELHADGKYNIHENEKYYLLETSIGEYDFFEGERVPLDYPMENIEKLDDADYKGREVELNKPKRGGSKKYYVYVKNPETGNVNKVEFGARGMSVKVDDPDRRKAFAARHNCTKKTDKTTPGYWACRLGRYPHLTGGSKSYKWW